MNEEISQQLVADEFFAAAQAAGLKKVLVFVGKVADDMFVVTMTARNPVAEGENDQFLASSAPFEFEDENHVRRIAVARARLLADSIPTIH